MSFRTAIAIANTVVARKVGSDLCWHHDVINGKRIFKDRHGELDNFMTFSFQFFDLRFETFTNFRGDIIVIEISNYPDTLLRASFNGCFIVIIWQRSEVFFILTASNRHQEVKVFRILSKETNYISTGSHSYHTVTWNRTVSRLQTIDAVKGSWLANRTTSVGTSGKRHNI